MAHNLDINEGLASFVSAREDAWHQLGTTLDHAFTAEEAMTEGLLGGWNVRKVPAFAQINGRFVPVAGKYTTVRDNPVTKGQVDVFDVVGEKYHPIQNEEHAEFLNILVEESGAHFETAGALEGGKKVFITMKLPGHILVGGVDAVDTYIAAVNSHDGSSSFTMMTTPVRVVCQNTLNMALGQAKNVFRVRHSRGAEKAIRQQARTSLDMTFDYLDAFNLEAEKLINTTLTQSAFEELIAREFGAPEDATQAMTTRREAQLDEMSRLFADSFTHEGVRETAWAGANALTEWYDHFSAAKSGAVGDADTSRAVNALFYPEFKTKAFNLVKEAVGL